MAKTVGSAVTRNTVRRRLKAIAFELVSQTEDGTDVVIRALPSSATVPWADLRREVVGAMSRNPRSGRSSEVRS